MKFIRSIAFLLVIISALNGGLWGFFQWDLVGDMLGGPYSVAARVVFSLMGLAGLYCIGVFYCIYREKCK